MKTERASVFRIATYLVRLPDEDLSEFTHLRCSEGRILMGDLGRAYEYGQTKLQLCDVLRFVSDA